MVGRGGEYAAGNEEEEEEGGPEELSMDDEEQVDLLEEWAAGEIQNAWRKYQLRRGDLDHGDVQRSPPSSTRQATAASSGEICCACFAPLTREDSRPTDANATSVQLFCVSCQHQLERGSRGLDSHGNATPTTSSIASPLPKLSLLVQTEAKYQDQLRLLRQQQELLKQQQQEIETRKKIQAETQQIAKQLARQRRRHFQQLMARRQAEEAQKIQEMAGSHSEEPTVKRRSKPVKPPAETATSCLAIEPGQLRRHRIPAPPQPSKAHDAASNAAELAEKAAQEHRRKQKIDTMKCYAQDLTPLVHGHKPKKLPLPARTPTGATGVKKSTQKPTKPSKITLIPLQKPSQARKKALQNNNNNQDIDQHKQRQDDAFSEELRLLIPRRTNSHAMPTPLTAEIKPVSWMDELLSSDPVLKDPSYSMPSHSNTTASASILGTSLSSMTQSRTQLTALLEEDDEYGDHEPRYHSLRSSFSGSGQRVTLAPLATSSIPTTAVSTTTSSTVAPPKREYTSERLASLLEKYHVSVSTDTSATK